MFVVISNKEYKQRINRYININYEQYSWVKVRDTLSEYDIKSAKLILTDDLSLKLDMDIKVMYLTERPMAGDMYIYKYQNFKEILEQLECFAQPSNRVSDLRIIAVSSLVGGVGKSKVSHALTSLLSTRKQALLLPLMDSDILNSTRNLSDFIFEALYNEENCNIEDYIYRHEQINKLCGLKIVDDLMQSEKNETLKILERFLKNHGITDLIIDMPPLAFSLDIFNQAPIQFLIRHQKRHQEEEEIIKWLDLDLSDKNIIHNFSEISHLAGHLPTISDIDNRGHLEFDMQLNQIMKEVGILES